jgi:hypothetical protein
MGDKLALSPSTKTALDNLGQEGAIPESGWAELERQILDILEKDNFDRTKLQPEISYFDTKKGKKMQSIKINYLV